MITVISGTNRLESETIGIARFYFQRISDKTDQPIQFYSLDELPDDVLHSGMYEASGQSKELRKIQEEMIIPAEKLLFVVPEYNGGIPGALKVFIDACSVWRYHETFKNKKACLAGISSGRAGNLRGMEHLTGILNYLGVNVMPNKLPISSIEKLVNDNGVLDDTETIKVIDKQIREFLAF